MSPFRRHFLLKCLELFDLVAISASFTVATLAVYYASGTLSLVDFLSMRAKVHNFVFFSLFLIGGHVSLVAFGLYKSRRLATRASDILDILKATSLGTLIIWVAGRLFHFVLLSGLFATIFFASTIIVLAGSRLLLRWVLHHVRRSGRNLRFLLIVGTNPRAIRFAREVEARPDLGYKIVGFVDNEWAGTGEFRQNGYSLVTNFQGFRDFIRENVVDEVVIELPIKSLYQVATRIVGVCEEQGIIVRYLPNLFNPRVARLAAEDLEDHPTIALHSGGHDGLALLIKRSLDACVSVSMIILLSPLLFLIALAIRLSSPGPVLFIQNRVGLNKRHFRLLKFRTMIPGAEKQQAELEALNEMGGPVFKIREDPRITPIGRILRNTSLDELPQLFNVLKGDMSLVGPRPLPLRDYEGFDCDWHRRRLSVRPGITCLWQVEGRNSVSFERWMELDMQYIDQWSLMLDFTIMARTIPAVLRGTGAA